MEIPQEYLLKLYIKYNKPKLLKLYNYLSKMKLIVDKYIKKHKFSK